MGRQVAIDTIFAVCDFVDDVPPAETGELLVEDLGGAGAVFIEDGRICWAAARGLSRRLTELLVARAQIDRSAMEGLFRACRTEGIPLGEYLVDKGVVAAHDLRSALAQHTIESLQLLTGPGRRAAWCPRARGRYSARFTFGTAEVLTRATAACDARLADRAEAELRAWVSEGDWAAAFVRRPTRPSPDPIAVHGAAPASATALSPIAKWAASALDLVEAFDARDPLVAVTLPSARASGARARIAYRFHDLVIAGETQALSPARILNRRAQQRRLGG